MARWIRCAMAPRARVRVWDRGCSGSRGDMLAEGSVEGMGRKHG